MRTPDAPEDSPCRQAWEWTGPGTDRAESFRKAGCFGRDVSNMLDLPAQGLGMTLPVGLS